MMASEVMPAPVLAEHVVTVHGWGMTGLVTHLWNTRLRQAGYRPSPFSYHSIRLTLEDNVRHLASHVRHLPNDSKVHFVGHSLGGIVIAQCLSQHYFSNAGRVVMVGTPFQGATAVRRLEQFAPGRWLLGKTIVQWKGVGQSQMPAGLEVGTIAGTHPYGLGRLLGGLSLPHDGTVSVAETHVPFARDHVEMKVTHTGMLMSQEVSHQIAHFLRNGAFRHP